MVLFIFSQFVFEKKKNNKNKTIVQYIVKAQTYGKDHRYPIVWKQLLKIAMCPP